MQIGEEPNVPAPLDGGSPGCLEAIAAGVSTALDERTMHGSGVDVGINTAGLADPVFWTKHAAAIGPTVLSRLDYIGLDMFPDVFRPVSEVKLAVASRFLVERLHTVTTDVGIPEHVPIDITETGWPTGDNRDEDKQARVLQTVAQAVISTSQVSVYEFFGLLHDDYTPKPAYEAVRRLIRAQWLQT